MILQIHIVDFKDIPLDVLLSSKYLSELEKESFKKFTNLDVKKEKIVSYLIKKKYVGDYYLNDKGKPLSKTKYFNISHSYGLLAYVESNNEIGIDIEKIRKVESGLINHVSSEEELNYIKSDEDFFKIWTNKEALTKALGSGITSKIKDIPSLPINGAREYQNKTFINKTIRFEDYVLTTSVNTKIDYELDIIREDI